MTGTYLGYFTDDESTAVHEAGHAVAAIRAGWPFSHIELTDPDDDSAPREQAGAMIWARDRETARDMLQLLYDNSMRRSLVIHSLAGAVAERLLCVEQQTKPFPSAPDVAMLADVGHYDPDVSGLLMMDWPPSQWLADSIREELQNHPRRRRRLERELEGVKRDHRKTEAQLDAIFAPDMPMVEAFVIENQRAIGEVANELWHRTWQRPDGESWRDLPYDEISAIVAKLETKTDGAV